MNSSIVATGVAAVAPQQLHEWLFDGGELALFDVREAGEYGAAHLFHAIPLPYSRLELEVRRLAPNPAVRTVVYDAGDGLLAQRAARRLQALGYQNVHLLQGGCRGWQAAGKTLFEGVHLPSKTFGELIEQKRGTPHISARQLADWQREKKPLVVLDGRPFSEYRKMNIPGGICCPNGELGYRINDLVPDDKTPIVVNCAGRTRSIIGAQTLIDLGIRNPVYALENGTQGWHLADLPLEHGSSRRYRQEPPAGVARQRQAAWTLARRVGVQPVAAAQVARWAQDPARSLLLCDVRSPEEFAVASLPGAQSTPGGQLIQATDHYLGVRGARVVVFDDEGIRAPLVAFWLQQLGHEVHVLSDAAGGSGLEAGRQAGLSLPEPAAPVLPRLPEVDAAELATALADDAVVVLDVRESTAFLEAQVPGSCWVTRAQLPQALPGGRPLVLVADDPALAGLAALELPAGQSVRVLRGGLPAWLLAGLPVNRDPDALQPEQRVDFLFFTHDRHQGNKAAARQYLAWETGLLGRLTPQERAALEQPVWQPEAGLDRATRLVHAGRPAPTQGAYLVNPPVSRLSTVLFSSLGELRDTRARRDDERLLSYGARGNPTAFALEDLITELEGGHRTRLFATGLAATAQVFLAYLRPGDHLLVTDGVYAPVRRLVAELLQPLGIEVSYFPADGTGLATCLRSNTRMVYAETPSSLLFELADLPAMAAVCRARNILLAVDNTWGSGYHYRPLALGAQISIMALTKYLNGHSDVMMGSVCTLAEVWPPLSRLSDTMGATVSPDDAYLVLRGARSLAARLATHQRHATEVAHWLRQRAEVARVFYPPLPEHPGHAIWQRDCTGANGLLTIELNAAAGINPETFIDALQLFGLGASWGGYESLVIPADVRDRQAPVVGELLRLHIGLEAPDALIRDLERAFETGRGTGHTQVRQPTSKETQDEDENL